MNIKTFAKSFILAYVGALSYALTQNPFNTGIIDEPVILGFLLALLLFVIIIYFFLLITIPLYHKTLNIINSKLLSFFFTPFLFIGYRFVIELNWRLYGLKKAPPYHSDDYIEGKWYPSIVEESVNQAFTRIMGGLLLFIILVIIFSNIRELSIRLRKSREQRNKNSSL